MISASLNTGESFDAKLLSVTGDPPRYSWVEQVMDPITGELTEPYGALRGDYARELNDQTVSVPGYARMHVRGEHAGGLIFEFNAGQAGGGGGSDPDADFINPTPGAVRGYVSTDNQRLGYGSKYAVGEMDLTGTPFLVQVGLNVGNEIADTVPYALAGYSFLGLVGATQQPGYEQFGVGRDSDASTGDMGDFGFYLGNPLSPSLATFTLSSVDYWRSYLPFVAPYFGKWDTGTSTVHYGVNGTDAIGNVFEGGICTTVGSGGGGGSGTVTSVDVSGGSTGLTTSGGAITTSGTITLAGTLNVGHGGTGLTSTPSNGQLLVGNGTNYTLATLTAGSGVTITNGSGTITIAASGGGGGSGTVTSIDVSGGSTGLTTSGGAVTTSGTITLAGTLNVGHGGTGLTGTPSNGQIPIGNGSGYTLAAITAGTGISVTNASGSITIAATGGGGSLPDPVTVAHGGTGLTSTGGGNGIILAGTTGTSNLQTLTNGSSGTVLKSNGGLATPSWATIPTILGAPVTVTGSKSSGAALTSLLSALVTLGLITDSTSA